MPMPWGGDQNRDLLDFYRKLIAIRKQEPSLTEGSRETVFVNDQVLAYRRTHGGTSLVCVMNITDQPAQVELDTKETNLLFSTSPDCAINAETGRTHLNLPALGGMILK